MYDFTFIKYRQLLETFYAYGWELTSVNHYNKNADKFVILRHDVDRFPNQTLQMAKLEKSINVQSTYYFRITKNVFKESVIKQVINYGHDIGYHYEDLAKHHGNTEVAIKSFEINLNKIRNYYPVNSICMHGSPTSIYDNKKLWEKYNYKSFGIVLDTSIDIDYKSVFYISDNGFGWNRTSTSIRDKIDYGEKIAIKSTDHLINLIKNNELPQKIMLNAHPDTFFNPGFKWVLNYSFINSKNVIKWIVIKTGIIK